MTKAITRRQAILGVSSALLVPAACSHLQTPHILSNSIFAHGVASGDPNQTSVVIWTRVSGTESPVAVDWYVATDAGFLSTVARGQYTTDKNVTTR